MSKISLIRLIAGILFTFSPALTLASSFSDVPDSASYSPAIEYLKQNGIVSGYPDGTFKPEQAINRAEALKITVLANEFLGRKLEISNLQEINYPDVKSSEWYFNYVKLSTNAGIVEGYPDGKFMPAVQINAVESLKIVLKTLDPKFVESVVTVNPYVDVEANQWFATYVDYAKKRQLIAADALYKFYPARKMTRGSYADLVYKLTFVEKNNLEEFPLSQNWAYCNNYANGYKVKTPADWQVIKADKQLVLWFQDKVNGQVSFARAYPNSGVIIMAIDTGAANTDFNAYINALDYGSGAQKNIMTLNDLPYATISESNSGFNDSYFKLKNGNVLIAYTQIGNGPISEQLKEEIRYVLGSVRESSAAAGDSSDNCTNSTNQNTNPNNSISEQEKMISMINQLVLIKGQSGAALNLIGDEMILETDTLGIGTGPIDYYYSPSLNFSLKIDRNAATILAVKKDKTSKF